MGVYYVDREYVLEEDAVIPVSDLALLRGYGAFDFLRTYGGIPFCLKEHLMRLYRSAELLELECLWTVEELEAIVLETLRKNSYKEANIRIVITGGESLDSITPSNETKLLVMVTEVQSFPQEWYSKGVKVTTSSLTRYIPGAKSTDYTKAIMMLKKAHSKEAIESLYMDAEETVFEGTTSNFFIVRDGRIITPEAGILPGVTRKVVLQLAAGVFDVELRPISREEILQADEAFLTSSNKEVAPVIMVDDAPIGSGRVGEVTGKLMTLFRNYVTNYGK